VQNTFHLSIPALGVNTDFTSNSLLKGASTVSLSSPASGTPVRLTGSNVNYAALGIWQVDATNPNTVFLGAYVTGYQTPASSMPTSGTASYGGTHNVTAVVSGFASDGTLNRGVVLGDASYTANFVSGSLTGLLTNMKVTINNVPTTPWNDVNVAAQISGNGFSGSATAVAPAQANSFTVTGGATGNFDGNFYGPNANELAGVWSLKDASHTVIGVAHGRNPLAAP